MRPVIRSEDIHVSPEFLEGLTEEARQFFADALLYPEKAKDFLAGLSLFERVQILDRLMDAEFPMKDIFGEENYGRLLMQAGSSIDMADPDFRTVAIQVILNRNLLREEAPVPVENKEGFDGFQTANERRLQSNLARVMVDYLPSGLGLSADAYIDSLHDLDVGVSLALLSVSRKDKDPYIEEAWKRLSARKLTSSVWSEFSNKCFRINTAPGLLAEKLEDQIDILTLEAIGVFRPAEELASLSDFQAWKLACALMAGEKETGIFKAARAVFYAHLPLSKALAEARQHAADSVAAGFLSLPDTEIDKWQYWKTTWGLLGNEEKVGALRKYVSLLSPKICGLYKPELHIVPMDKDSDEEPEGGFAQDRNLILMYDGIHSSGMPLSLNLSFRNSLSTAAHENLHSGDAQRMAIRLDDCDPLRYSTELLRATRNDSIRGKYIRAKDNYDLYRNQPFEKNASLFQNAFAAAANGVLVLREVEKGRDLVYDIRTVFNELAQALTLPGKMNSANIISVGHPPGVVTSDTIDAADQSPSGVAVGYSQLEAKMDTLRRLQRAADEVQNKGSTSAFLDQSVSLLNQMPDELWPIMAKTSEPQEKEQLYSLTLRTKKLVADVGDYRYIESRWDAISKASVVALEYVDETIAVLSNPYEELPVEWQDKGWGAFNEHLNDQLSRIRSFLEKNPEWARALIPVLADIPAGGAWTDPENGYRRYWRLETVEKYMKQQPYIIDAPLIEILLKGVYKEDEIDIHCADLLATALDLKPDFGIISDKETVKQILRKNKGDLGHWFMLEASEGKDNRYAAYVDFVIGLNDPAFAKEVLAMDGGEETRLALRTYRPGVYGALLRLALAAQDVALVGNLLQADDFAFIDCACRTDTESTRTNAATILSWASTHFDTPTRNAFVVSRCETLADIAARGGDMAKTVLAFLETYSDHPIKPEEPVCIAMGNILDLGLKNTLIHGQLGAEEEILNFYKSHAQTAWVRKSFVEGILGCFEAIIMGSGIQTDEKTKLLADAAFAIGGISLIDRIMVAPEYESFCSFYDEAPPFSVI